MSKIVIFSGAGLSADSGLGVFRGSNGLWNNYDINKVCNINTWEENYNLVHEFYSKRRKEYLNAVPNSMHKMIANLQNEYGAERVIVITQNIDNLLEKAGCTNVQHLHGFINFIHCTNCGKEYYIEDDFVSKKCDRCGCTHFKPSIVFFGEAAPEYEKMYISILSLDENDGICVIGTEGSVIPIAQIIGPMPGNETNSKLRGIKAKRLLCNLEKSKYLPESIFNEIIYDRAEVSSSRIYDFCKEILNSK